MVAVSRSAGEGAVPAREPAAGQPGLEPDEEPLTLPGPRGPIPRARPLWVCRGVVPRPIVNRCRHSGPVLASWRRGTRSSDRARPTRSLRRRSRLASCERGAAHEWSVGTAGESGGHAQDGMPAIGQPGPGPGDQRPITGGMPSDRVAPSVTCLARSALLRTADAVGGVVPEGIRIGDAREPRACRTRTQGWSTSRGRARGRRRRSFAPRWRAEGVSGRTPECHRRGLWAPLGESRPRHEARPAAVTPEPAVAGRESGEAGHPGRCLRE